MKTARPFVVGGVMAALMVAPAAVVASPNGTPAGRPKQYLPLAGSPTALVYEVVQTGLGVSVKGDCYPYGGQCQPQQLVVRDIAGNERVLADLTSSDVPLIRWSLSGTMLTAVQGDDHSKVYWWDISSSDRGQLTIPKKSYISAGPTGVVYLAADGDLELMDTAGVVTTLVPDYSRHRVGRHGAANGTGVVITAIDQKTQYVRFADPGNADVLARTGTCWALAKRYAACTATANSPAGHSTIAELAPLNGSRVRRFGDRRKERFGPVALDGSHTLVWSTFTKRPNKYSNGVLTCRAAHAYKPSSGHRVVPFGVVISALGHAVSASASGRRLVITTDCPKTALLVSPTPASARR